MNELVEQPEQYGKEYSISLNKSLRSALDSVRIKLRDDPHRKSRERSLAMTKVEEAIMWLGMDMRALADGVSCYEESYNPQSTVVHDVPDGVLMK